VGARQQPMTDVEKLEDATRRAKEATTEARQAYQDLRGCMREFEELIVTRSRQIYNSEIESQLDRLAKVVNVDLDNAKQGAIRSFQRTASDIVATLDHIARKLVGADAAKTRAAADDIMLLTEKTVPMMLQDVRDSGLVFQGSNSDGTRKGTLHTGNRTIPPGAIIDH
jgi:hypothetical protein